MTIWGVELTALNQRLYEQSTINLPASAGKRGLVTVPIVLLGPRASQLCPEVCRAGRPRGRRRSGCPRPGPPRSRAGTARFGEFELEGPSSTSPAMTAEDWISYIETS